MSKWAQITSVYFQANLETVKENVYLHTIMICVHNLIYIYTHSFFSMNIGIRNLPSPRFGLSWAPRSRLHFSSTESCDVMTSSRDFFWCHFFGCKKETTNVLNFGNFWSLVVIDDVNFHIYFHVGSFRGY